MNGGGTHGILYRTIEILITNTLGGRGIVMIVYPLVNLPGSNPKVTQMELVKTSRTQRKQKVIDAGIRLVKKRGVVRRGGR